MFELRTTPDELKEMLSLMSLPNAKQGPLFDPIAPTFIPEGEAHLMTKDKGTFQISKFTNLSISGIDAPMQVPMRASKILSYLDLYDGADEIAFVYDTDTKELKIVDLSEGIKDDVFIPSIVLKDVSTTFTELPIKFDDNGSPVFKGGTVIPDIKVTLDVSILQSQIKKANKVDVDPRIFYLEFLADNTLITKVGDKKFRDKDRIDSATEVISLQKPSGICKCAYALGFEEVISNLYGSIDLLTLNGGPLWITYETDTSKSNYLIAPAAL